MGADVNLVLEPFIRKAQAGTSRALTSAMRYQLKVYSNIPEILTRTAIALLRLEQLFDEPVRMTRVKLFEHLLQTEDDWIMEVPMFPSVSGDGAPQVSAIEFRRVPVKSKVSLPAFMAAMTVGRALGLFQGHGHVALSTEFLQSLRRRSECLRS